jgi:hypothetical protein
MTKKMYIANEIDGTNHQIINSDGFSIKNIVREEIADVCGSGFKILQDWMNVVEDMLMTLGGFYTFIDASSDGVGLISLLASFGVFGAIAGHAAYTGAAMKSLFIEDGFFDAMEAAADLKEDVRDEFVDAPYSSSSNAV